MILDVCLCMYSSSEPTGSAVLDPPPLCCPSPSPVRSKSRWYITHRLISQSAHPSPTVLVQIGQKCVTYTSLYLYPLVDTI